MRTAAQRLLEVRKRKRLTQRAMAKELGVSPSLIAALELGDRSPSRDFLLALSNLYGVSADWVLHGAGEVSLPQLLDIQGRKGVATPVDQDAPAHGDLRFDGTEFSYVRRMELSVSAGSGVVALDDGVAWGMSLPTSWFSRNQVNADLVVMVRVRGDSMAPTIPDGAHILVHLPEKSPNRPGIYAFALSGECFVKRLLPGELDPDGRPRSVAIISDNPAYPPAFLNGDTLVDLRVIGRVRAAFVDL